MSTKSRIKKEVSCKTLIPIFNAAAKNGIDLTALLNGVPYKFSYLLNKHERIEWDSYCKIISNSRKYFAPSDYESMGVNYVKHGSYIEGVLGAYILFSSSKISRILSKHFFRMAENSFTCIKHNTFYPAKNRIKVTAFLEDNYEFCPELFYISKGVWEQFGEQTGHKEFKIDVTWIHQGVIFDVSWKNEIILFKIKQWYRWLFNIRKAFLDLTDSHEELLNQYNKLEESKSLLQKQTVQLKTAYEIAKSIRQSFDIGATLNAVTNALVFNAGFSSALIRLFKDIEGNNFEIENFSGINENNSNPLKRSILIDNKKTGELIIYPKAGKEISECDELLNYLLPIINISIHDSLILLAVTDYKNNLETKVNERTLELKSTYNKLQDAQLVQNRFYTNISHEFRTPLTLILGPVKQIIESTNDRKTRDKLQVVHKNAGKLLELVNELLDISKIESGNMKLRTSRQDIVSLLKVHLQSFYPYAERKRINLKFISAEDEITAYIDKEKIEKIITNILSNAFKFTPEGGAIEVAVKTILKPALQEGPFKIELVSKKEETYRRQVSSHTAGQRTDNAEFVEISISDTGIGIPEENISYIFDRFYQVDGSHTREHAGTGIGLSLTKELVDLHKGKIEVESQEGKGTTFTITLPLGTGHLKPEEIYELKKEEKILPFPEEPFYQDIIKKDFDAAGEANGSGLKTVKPVLLIIEDNSDVRDFIKNNMSSDYTIIEACDGEDGWNSAVEHFPDLIISDIMMPKMDGLRLCERLKTDQRTSHIPVILLTAKASSEDKIDGFETGADEYLMKPFDTEELRSRIKNLIEQRRRIHEHFKNHGLFEIEEKKVTPADQKFLQRVAEIINEDISNPDFNVEMLTEKLGLGRSNLNKKFTALIGEPPVEFIRRTKLNKAAELIERNFGNISEIALESGFNNPAYFSACFKRQFGVIPSRYRGRMK